MKNLLMTLRCAYYLWKMGFYLSDNTRVDPNGEHWGFIRLNFVRGKVEKYALADFDFAIRDGKVVFVNMKANQEKECQHELSFRYNGDQKEKKGG